MNFFKPEVGKCEVDGCTFNKDKTCRALSISVGGPHQECDTFILGNNKTGSDGATSVGACNVPGCNYNKNSRCHSEGINLAWHGNHADCMTFAEKS